MAWAADLVAVIAVAFGVAASICMGVLQLQSGLHVVAGVPMDSVAWPLGILTVLMACALTSATTGLDKGIKWLSNINMALAFSYLFLFGVQTLFLMFSARGTARRLVHNVLAVELGIAGTTGINKEKKNKPGKAKTGKKQKRF